MTKIWQTSWTCWDGIRNTKHESEMAATLFRSQLIQDGYTIHTSIGGTFPSAATYQHLVR